MKTLHPFSDTNPCQYTGLQNQLYMRMAIVNFNEMRSVESLSPTWGNFVISQHLTCLLVRFILSPSKLVIKNEELFQRPICAPTKFFSNTVPKSPPHNTYPYSLHVFPVDQLLSCGRRAWPSKQTRPSRPERPKLFIFPISRRSAIEGSLKMS